MVRRCRLVWSRAHDWKSCKPQNGFEGSNLSISAKTKDLSDRTGLFVFPKKEDLNPRRGFVVAAERRGFRTAESRATQPFLSSPTSEQKRQGGAEYLSISAKTKRPVR